MLPIFNHESEPGVPGESPASRPSTQCSALIEGKNISRGQSCLGCPSLHHSDYT